MKTESFRYREKYQLRLQLAGTAEGSDREGDEDEADDDGYSDQPMGYIAVPGAERGINPHQGEHGKKGANDFVK